MGNCVVYVTAPVCLCVESASVSVYLSVFTLCLHVQLLPCVGPNTRAVTVFVLHRPTISRDTIPCVAWLSRSLVVHSIKMAIIENTSTRDVTTVCMCSVMVTSSLLKRQDILPVVLTIAWECTGAHLWREMTMFDLIGSLRFLCPSVIHP